MRLFRHAGLWWSPQRLGRSLPIYRPLWISRIVVIALTLIATALAATYAYRGFDLASEPLAPDAGERLIAKRLAQLELAPWAPGPPLAETEAPEWLPAKPPPLWQGPHPAERAVSGNAGSLVAQARRDLAADNPQAAATRFLRAGDLQPTWEIYYSTGLALLRAGDYRRALPQWAKAVRRFEDLDAAGSRSAGHYATGIATRYGAGLTALTDRDCLHAIEHLRRAVHLLRRYVEVEGALVYDRKLPFRVAEADLDNHAVWSALAQAYSECEGRFPDAYPQKYGDQDFSDEYDSAESDEVAQGPFAEGLAACVAAGNSAPSTCWAWSNLNKVLWSSRSYLPEEDVEIKLEAPLAASLARLTYNAAWLVASSNYQEDRRQADRWLGYAARLDRLGAVAGLDQRIADLGRHLAPVTENYSPLAEPWRRGDLTQLTLDSDRTPEEIKGISWALSERWFSHLDGERPDRMIEEVDGQVRNAGPFGESLREWRTDQQEQMQKALADEIRIQYGNGNRPAAAAIRDFRADWLGEGWKPRAVRAWISPAMLVEWAGIFLVLAAFAAIVWLVHRLVVFPYLVYTTDAYRLEHRRRHRQRQDEGRPFTREEIEERRF